MVPLVPEGSRPGFQTGRDALYILGRLCYHLVFPYICVDLSLVEQLRHLSAAAHIALGLRVHDGTGKKFLPNQLYVDIMIMIKNVVFCIGKAKIDIPESSFWLILLGTDRWETLFGILRTMVGSDRNLDILQLAERLTGTTEVSNILANHPEWNKSPRRLVLSLVSKDGTRIPENVDGIKPRLWTGDLRVSTVTLLSVWKEGRRICEAEVPFLVPVVRQLDEAGNCDILRPEGFLLVHAELDADDLEDLGGVLGQDSLSDAAENTDGHQEFENLVADSLPSENISRTVTIASASLSKSKALAIAFKHLGSTSSTDRLKRVREESRYETRDSFVVDNVSEAAVLRVTEPIVTLLRCDNKLFMCIGEVNTLRWNSKTVDEIRIDRLMEPLAQVSFQVLSLIPATSDDDPTLKNDWCSAVHLPFSFKVSGPLVLAINPSLSTNTPMHPVYLFESSELVALTASLLERLNRLDLKGVPTIAQSNMFPYRESSGEFP